MGVGAIVSTEEANRKSGPEMTYWLDEEQEIFHFSFDISHWSFEGKMF